MLGSMFSCCRSIPEDWGEPGAFYPVRKECLDDVVASRFQPLPGKTLSARRWHASFSEEGVLDIAKVLRRIQRGGVHPTIKGVVWEFLLGCYDPKSTFDERAQIRERRRSEYASLKSKCQEMEKTVGSGKILTAAIISEDGRPIDDPECGTSATQQENQTENVTMDKAEIQWKLTLHQIGLDVVRTDRTLVYYENPSNDAKIWDILAVYSWLDRDIGYCQGMSDLCSPIVILIENEADAFWCFERLMRRVRSNFKCTASAIGVSSQLTVLSGIVKTIDPKLHEHMENLDGGEYLFAFRMLMVIFRREFSFVDILYLWEIMWGMEYSPLLFSNYESNGTGQGANETQDLLRYGKFERDNVKFGKKDQQGSLSIFLVAGVLESRNKKLLTEAKGLDDVVKILNDITGSLNAKKACDDAVKVHKNYLLKTKAA